MDLKLNNKPVIHVSLLAIILIFCLSFPLISGSIEAIQLLKVSILFSCFFILGSIATTAFFGTDISKLWPIHVVLPYLLLIFTFPILFVQSISHLIIPALAFITSVIVVLIKPKVIFNTNKHLWIVTSFSIVIILLFFRIAEAFSSVPLMYENYFQDNYWFTAMTASIKDADFTTSLYEENTGVYHHILGLFPAANISVLSSIPTHIALWSISMPYSIFCSLSGIYLLINILFRESIRNSTLFFALLTIIGLFPINPSYLLKGKFMDMIWFGPGNTLPVLPTWSAVYIISCLFAVVLIKTTLKNCKGMFLIGFILSFCLVWAKITSFAMFWGMCLVFLLIYERSLFTPRLKLLIISVIPAIILILTYYSNSAAKFVIEPGYIIEHFLTVPYRLTLSNLLKALGVALVTIAIWLNVKFLIFLVKKSKEFTALNFSLISGIIVSILLMSILRIYAFDSQGNLADDSSFDLLQFCRSTFIYLSIAFSVFIAFILEEKVKIRILQKRALLWIITSWSSVVLMLSIKSQFHSNQNIIKRTWDIEVVAELKSFQKDKKAMISDFEYSGQFLSAFDLGPWYCSIENRNGGYTYNYEHVDRYQRLKQFLTKTASFEYLDELRANDVKILVATPNTQHNFSTLVSKKVLKHVSGTKWLFTYD